MFSRLMLAGFAAALLCAPPALARGAEAAIGPELRDAGEPRPRSKSRTRRTQAAQPGAEAVEVAESRPRLRLSSPLPPARPEELRETLLGASTAQSTLADLPGRMFGAPTGPTPGGPIATAPAQPGSAEPSTNWFSTLFGGLPAQPRGTALPPLAGRAEIESRIAHYAKLNGVPESLVHRVVIRESKYNPRAVGRGGAMGLMQIKTGTARALGYQGGPAGLLDAETNLTYAVKYLAGAYRTAGGNHDLAVRYYASGYYYAAKRQRVAQDPGAERRRFARRRGLRQEVDASPAPQPAPAPSFLTFLNQGGDAASR